MDGNANPPIETRPNGTHQPSGPLRRLAYKLIHKAAVKTKDHVNKRIEQRQERELPGLNCEAPEAFSYDPIDSSNREIRLLRILPAQKKKGKQPQFIHCELTQVSLHARPQYIALSYVWGDPSRRLPIWINGQALHVTENLLVALRWLREHGQADRYLWIDAICICQRDVDEKSAQVSMMGQIYRAAVKVLVWLGPAHEQQLRDIGDIGVAAEAAGVWTVVKEAYTDQHAGLRELMSELKDNWIPGRPKTYPHVVVGFDPKKTFLGILQSPWFHRTWTLQEVALATNATLASGSVTLPFALLVSAMKLLELWLAWKPSELAPAAAKNRFHRASDTHDRVMMDEALREMRLVYKQPPSFIFWKHFAQKKEPLLLLHCLCIVFMQTAFQTPVDATDPRDRVYSLLDISSDAESLAIRPDYRKSVHTVYIELARTLLQRNYYNLLLWCRGRRLHGLPSWVPDWTARMIEPWNMNTCFWASGQWVEQGLQLQDAPLDAPELSLLAVEVGVVAQRGSNWSGLPRQHASADNIEAASLRFQEIENFLRQSDQYLADDDAIWRIPISNAESTPALATQLATDVSRRGYAAVCAMLQRYYASLASPVARNTFNPRPWGVAAANTGMSNEINWTAYHVRMRNLEESCPVLTSSGFVGLAPSACQVEDVVIIPLGSRVPFVVRPDGRGRHWLIGEAYLHGIMHGEFMQQEVREPAMYVLA